jgi:hypothetical protein
MPHGNIVPSLIPTDLAQAAIQSQVSGYQLDVTVDGIPFNLDPTGENPLVWEVREDRRDQIDQSTEMGEQTFGFWWLRSQSTWHGGAGQTFLDSGTEDSALTRIRFDTSFQMDVFSEIGQTTPRGAATNTSITSVVRGVPFIRSGVNKIAIAKGNTDSLDFYNTSPFAFDTNVSLSEAAASCLDITSDGERLFVAINNKVIRIDEAGTQVDIATLTYTKSVRLVYAKKRLLLAHGPDVYQVDTDPGAPPVALGAGQRVFQLRTPNWAFTDIAEGPNGIYLTGFAGLTGQVWQLSETESGGTVTLGAGTLQITLPTGEVPYAIFFYVNSLFVLGTSEGARVGSFTPDGRPQFGPLSFDLSAVRAVGAVGAIVHLGTDSGVYDVDLSTLTSRAGTYAFAHRQDRTTGSTYNSMVTSGSIGAVSLFAIHATGIERESADSAGWVRTSWMTWSTTEQKRAYSVVVGARVVTGTMTVTVENFEGDTTSFVAGADAARTVWEFGLGLDPSGAYRIRVDFTGGTDQNFLNSFQLKALPQERRFESVVLPLMIFNYEQTSGGLTIGYDNFALERLQALVTMAKNNRTIQVQLNDLGVSYLCQAKDLQFRQTDGIARKDGQKVGGMVNLVLRVVA